MAGESYEDRAERLTAEALEKDAQIADLVEQVENLYRAKEHAAVIEQAKGIIMHTMGCGPDAAFAALVAQSQNQNRKLWDVANELADAQDRTEHVPTTSDRGGAGGSVRACTQPESPSAPRPVYSRTRAPRVR